MEGRFETTRPELEQLLLEVPVVAKYTSSTSSPKYSVREEGTTVIVSAENKDGRIGYKIDTDNTKCRTRVLREIYRGDGSLLIHYMTPTRGFAVVFQ